MRKSAKSETTAVDGRPAPGGRAPRRAGLDPDVITRAAVELVDSEGAAALTTTNLARRLGVTQPALYAHVANLAAVQRAVGLYGMRQMSEELRASVMGKSGAEALRALAETYRDYVRAYPDRFLLQVTAPPSPEYHQEGERAAEAVRAVLRSFGIDEDEVRLAHQFFRSTVHGFAAMELHAGAARESADAVPGATAGADAGFEYFLEQFTRMLRRDGR
ncbi:TetR/AcrR family transcriptional regulator [Yinghuangia sp. YIM S09857]|uniref:TetR/AcrR family transcriptional regulator n=1 Tax=Yinghuangia sp. YIM S09857 TaxID=3436929 RepID=UPI003F5371CE